MSKSNRKLKPKEYLAELFKANPFKVIPRKNSKEYKKYLKWLKQTIIKYRQYSEKYKNVYYVYVLLDPRKSGPFYYGNWKFEYQPFYVGKGTGNRFKFHRMNSGTTNPFKANIINKIRREGKEYIELIKINNISNNKACILEKKLIKVIGRRTLSEGPLVNLTSGGEGTPERVIKKETRLKMSKSNKIAYAKLSDKKKEARSKKHKETIKNMPEEKRKAWIEKRIKTIMSKSSEEKAVILQKQLLTKANKSPEEKARIKAKEMATKNAKSEKEKQRIIEQYKVTYARRTPEQREASRLKRLETYARKIASGWINPRIGKKNRPK